MGKIINMTIKKPLKMTIIIVAILLVLIAIARAREDYWYKDGSGNWVKHGNPAGAPPGD